MSGFVCPHCSECTALFSSGGGEALANELNIKFLARVPIDPTLTTLIEKNDYCKVFQQSQLFPIFQGIISQI